MSIRYGVSLLTDPDFTARSYRARQLICGQYACWAAEMHMVHLPMSDYFPFEGADDPNAEVQAGRRAAATCRPLPPRLAAVFRYSTGALPLPAHGSDGNIWLDFSPRW